MQSLIEPSGIRFRHERIDNNPPCTHLSFCLTSDLTGNGLDDVIVGGSGPETRLWVLGSRSRLPNAEGIRQRLGRGATHIFWYENPGWHRHKLGVAPHLSVGSALHDVNGDGRVDLITGQNIHYNDIYWFEQPADPTEPWTRHLLTDSFEKYHDIAVGDLDDDGEPEVVCLSQQSETVFYYDIPDDPYREPWPDDHRHIIAEGTALEGVEIADIDGDGRTEVIAGPTIYRQPSDPDNPWMPETIETGWEQTRVAVCDIDGDNELEIVLTEGDSPAHGTHPARLAWFDPPDWEPHYLEDDLFCPHSLQVKDFDGDGRPDIYIGEMSLGENANPVHLLYRNQGGGEFEREVIARGIATHEAQVVDLTGNGRPDIVGKTYTPDHHVDVWYNEG